MAPPRIKGVSFINRYTFLEQRFGEAGLQKVMNAIKPQTAEILRASVATDFYPLAPLVEIDRAIVASHLGGEVQRATELGRFSVEQAINRVYTLLFRIVDPGKLIDRSMSLWKKMVEGGRIETARLAENAVEVRVFDLDPLDDVFCHVLRGSLLATLAASGRKQAVVEHPECTLHGGKAVVFRLKW
jgi:hypothetical protein